LGACPKPVPASWQYENISGRFERCRSGRQGRMKAR
jgi:hypothetical protein